MKNSFLALVGLVALLFTSCKDDVTAPDATHGGTGLILNSKAALANVDEADIDEDAYGNALPTAFSLN